MTTSPMTTSPAGSAAATRPSRTADLVVRLVWVDAAITMATSAANSAWSFSKLGHPWPAGLAIGLAVDVALAAALLGDRELASTGRTSTAGRVLRVTTAAMSLALNSAVSVLLAITVDPRYWLLAVFHAFAPILLIVLTEAAQSYLLGFHAAARAAASSRTDPSGPDSVPRDDQAPGTAPAATSDGGRVAVGVTAVEGPAVPAVPVQPSAVHDHDARPVSGAAGEHPEQPAGRRDGVNAQPAEHPPAYERATSAAVDVVPAPPDPPARSAPSAPSAPSGSVRARDRAADAARAHRARNGVLPTVTALMDLADVSRGTAAGALQDVRAEPAHPLANPPALHIVPTDTPAERSR